MPIENATTINQLDENSPAGSERLSEADDHLRLIKNTIKTTFPEVEGVVDATHTELNNLEGSTSNLQTQINALIARIATLENAPDLGFPKGTRVLIFGSTVPSGWRQVTEASLHGSAVRIVSSSVGGTIGGSNDIASVSHNHATADHALTEQEMPEHHHNTGFRLSDEGGNNSSEYQYGWDNQTTRGFAVRDGSFYRSVAISGDPKTADRGGGQPHNHGSTDSTLLNLKYVDCMIIEKL